MTSTNGYGPMYHGRTALYRLYDETGRLLYVGVTGDPEERWYTHELTQFWWREVKRKERVWMKTRAQALAAERRAIRIEKPLYDRSDRKARLSDEERRARAAVYVARVVQAIEQDIRTAAFPPATVIPQRQLANRYDLPADAIGHGLSALRGRGLVTYAHGYWIAQDPETFPRDLAYRYGVLYALGFQAFGQEPFTMKEVQERTRLTSSAVNKGLHELRSAGVAKVVGRRKGHGPNLLWVLLPAPAVQPVRESLEPEIGL